MAIHVNQVGYFPKEKKRVVFSSGTEFFLISEESKQAVLKGSIPEKRFDATSGDEAAVVDFSGVTAEGSYYFENEAGERSCCFQIQKNIYKNMKKDILKAFYFQRCGCALTEEYAGVFKHAICHTAPVDELLVEKDEKTVVKTEPDGKPHFPIPQKKFTILGKKKEINGGWHDAGDYGRYTTAAATALSHMLYAYKQFPEQWTEETGIPESGNGIPDLLNECLYELRWLLKMQKEDGSVYHKLTALSHAGFVLPEEDTSDFFLYPVSSQATADFAAIMALAAGVYREFDAEFANQAEEKAKRAYIWLQENPDMLIEMNPEGTHTGSYFDFSDTDERAWAAAELFVLTGDRTYEENLMAYAQKLKNPTVFGWGDVSGFAGLAILLDEKAQAFNETRDFFKKAFSAECDRLVKTEQESPYGLALSKEDYTWGSNMNVLNHAMLLAVTGQLTGEKTYHNASVSLVDYILGKNALDVSYITGYGEHAYAHPHNRPTIALGDKVVMAGWLSGGPNGRPSDVVAKENLPEGTPPMRCFVDKWECYSLNEITIYWNSLMVYMTAYLLHIN